MIQFGFKIQLALLRVFNVKVKNLAFVTSTVITNASFSMKNYRFVLFTRNHITEKKNSDI